MNLFHKRDPWHGPDSPKESRLFGAVLGIGVALISVISVICLIEGSKEWARLIGNTDRITA